MANIVNILISLKLMSGTPVALQEYMISAGEGPYWDRKRASWERPDVKLLKFRHPIETAETRSQPDLVASVTRMAACLECTRSEDDGEKAQHGEVVRTAVTAALSAEQRMADQLERIAYLERLAINDELTGVLNRRGFMAELQRILSASSRYGEQGVLAYADLDGFKPINDTYGHAAGDEVLWQMAKLLSDNVRDIDFVGRVGGDEFAILLTRTTWKNGIRRAQALERLVNHTFISWKGKVLALRASFGIQTYGDGDQCEGLMNRADEAMYRAKRSRSDLQDRRVSA